MKKETEKKIWFGVGALFVLVLLCGVSYAYWKLNVEQKEQNVVNVDCFKIEFTEANPISLDKAYPIEDQEGMKNVPYTFTIQNICEGSARYQINLESLGSDGKVLPDYYIKANIS